MARAFGEGLASGQLGQPATFKLDAVGLMGEPQVRHARLDTVGGGGIGMVVLRFLHSGTAGGAHSDNCGVVVLILLRLRCLFSAAPWCCWC